MHIEIFSRLTLRGRKHFFRVVASNGKTVAQSQSYTRRIDCKETAESMCAQLGPRTKVIWLD